ncbi:hypothetical protein LEP1GSC047_3289 [Leptospira inadai serovar Lyme str. 10]|uniref:Uncharacterized protein n=1 Tax=Leptospira inadai serovar Lyme str. 10 TaxID=1049790 RepID=V6HA02_9LEPT|nr:hypothetical protein LEP1GSC047_3289 [Leptospira inadai serovar Lyme str. 10]
MIPGNADILDSSHQIFQNKFLTESKGSSRTLKADLFFRCQGKASAG